MQGHPLKKQTTALFYSHNYLYSKTAILSKRVIIHSLRSFYVTQLIYTILTLGNKACNVVLCLRISHDPEDRKTEYERREYSLASRKIDEVQYVLTPSGPAPIRAKLNKYLLHPHRYHLTTIVIYHSLRECIHIFYVNYSP